MIYQYICKNCGNTFEKNLKVEDREMPLKEVCEKCKEENTIEIKIGNILSIWNCQKSTL